MQTKKVGSGEKGEAKVRIRGSKVDILFKESNKTYSFERDDLPDYLKAGTFYVIMNGDGNEVLSIHPMRGEFHVRFSHFAAKEGELPSPKENPGGPKPSKSGKGTYVQKPYLSYMPILQVTNKELEGMEIPLFLTYSFAEGDDGNTVMEGRGQAYDKNFSFLDLCGVLEDEMPYKDNLLPKLQARILKKGTGKLGKEFGVIVVDGFISEMFDLDTEAEEDKDPEDDEEEEKPEPAPKTRSKAKAKVAEPEDEPEEDPEPAPKSKAKTSSAKKKADPEPEEEDDPGGWAVDDDPDD